MRIDNNHKRFIRSLPCAACGGHPTECAHVRTHHFGDVVVPIDERGGTGIKPADKWSVPLCAPCHRKQHTHGEVKFWDFHQINPLRLAQALWCHNDQRVAALNILLRHRNGAEDL